MHRLRSRQRNVTTPLKVLEALHGRPVIAKFVLLELAFNPFLDLLLAQRLLLALAALQERRQRRSKESRLLRRNADLPDAGKAVDIETVSEPTNSAARDGHSSLTVTTSDAPLASVTDTRAKPAPSGFQAD
jgi:hypothetical protein